MSNSVPLCTHVKTNGVVCGSPAVGGTELCYHHSVVRRALRARRNDPAQDGEGFAPMPFVFPEDRASVQINYFLLLQAFNEGEMDLRTYNCLLRLLRAMARNLGKTGSLMEARPEEEEEVPAQEEAGSRAQTRETSAEPGRTASASSGAASSADRGRAVEQPRPRPCSQPTKAERELGKSRLGEGEARSAAPGSITDLTERIDRAWEETKLERQRARFEAARVG